MKKGIGASVIMDGKVLKGRESQQRKGVWNHDAGDREVFLRFKQGSTKCQSAGEPGGGTVSLKWHAELIASGLLVSVRTELRSRSATSKYERQVQAYLNMLFYMDNEHLGNLSKSCLNTFNVDKSEALTQILLLVSCVLISFNIWRGICLSSN